ncbi:hypothetical protein [Shouchella miscanthi]|uniref:YitT family protein n=1 Tax=Shouchella miscanthi TaxID=2598861 RepID=A0ABU6NKX4_9BACI|nr:hypothetical protein [Shouchella miscanthi]
MIRIINYLFGVTFIGMGINMLIQANKGLDPWGIFNLAFADTLNISLGSFYVYSGVLFIAINALIQRKRPDILGLLTAFLIGASIDLFAQVNNLIFVNIAWLIFILGLLFFCLGLSLYLSTNFPRSPVDDLIFSIQKITGWSFKLSKIILDASVLIVGLLMGGVLGVGTVLMVLIVGPLITTFTKIWRWNNG